MRLRHDCEACSGTGRIGLASRPYEIKCPACGGRGIEIVRHDCRACGGTGRVALTGCPLGEIPADVWELLDYADLYHRGLPPEPGGALDQAAAFVGACRFVWAERERLKAESMTLFFDED